MSLNRKLQRHYHNISEGHDHTISLDIIQMLVTGLATGEGEGWAAWVVVQSGRERGRDGEQRRGEQQGVQGGRD